MFLRPQSALVSLSAFIWTKNIKQDESWLGGFHELNEN